MSTTSTVQKVAHDRGGILKITPSVLRSISGWLTQHSVTLLQVSMGTVIFGYGVLKYFPGVSPAEDLVETTMRLLTFGLVPDRAALVLVATLECVIGLSLILGRGMRVTIYLLMFWVIGVLSPIALLTHRLFSGPVHAPTLEGQYVIKDIVFLTAALVIATTLHRCKSGTENPSPRDEDR